MVKADSKGGWDRSHPKMVTPSQVAVNGGDVTLTVEGETHTVSFTDDQSDPSKGIAVWMLNNGTWVAAIFTR